MSGTDAQRDRLAAAARVLAEAEELVRAGALARSPGDGPVASSATKPGTRPGQSPVKRRGTRSSAEEAPGDDPTAGVANRSRMPGESASSAAARLWVAGDDGSDRRDGVPGTVTGGGEGVSTRRDHLDLRRASSAPLPTGGSVEPDREDEARQIVLRQLAMGPRTRRQLADKLRERECDDDVAALVLDRMTAVGLIDDEAYAATLVTSKQTGRGLSKRAIAQELRSKGVDHAIVEEALTSVDDESERARAQELAAKKMRAMGGLEPQVQSRRLIGMLARKGYPPSIIYAVVREVVNGAPEHQRD